MSVADSVFTGAMAVSQHMRAARAAFAPPPALTVSEFADQEIRLTSGLRAGNRWKTSIAPYQKGIMDAFHEWGVETVVGMCSSQVGKTSIALNMVAYHIAHDPCPILVVQPTTKPMAEDFSKNRLDPLIRATPILSKAVGERRSRDASNTVYSKTFNGGSVSITGAGSASSLAARPVRFLLLDEIDRFPPELPGEGSTIEIALARTKAFGRQRQVAMFSSPTFVGQPIHVWFEEGDQRRFYVPCPSCGEMNPYRWENVRWEDSDSSTAQLHCPGCDYGMDDAERVQMLQHGEWVAENPDREDETIVSFHLSELYSPFSDLQRIVKRFLKARKAQKAGDNSKMHTFQNTTLGEPIELEAGEGVDPDPLLLRREDYGECDVPAGACLLTMGVDVQDDRLELLVIGWGPGKESWLVLRDLLPGDPDGPEVWELLDDVLAHEFLHQSGARLPISATFIDSAGHRTDAVYEYCHRKATRLVFASIGRAGVLPIIKTPSMPHKRSMGGRKCLLYTVGVDAAKSQFVSSLKIDEPGPGYVHIPNSEWADDELVAQLASERLVTRWSKGRPVSAWVKVRARNEMLDCAVLNLAALRRLNPDLELLAQRLKNPEAVPVKKKRTDGRKPFLGRRRGGWLQKGGAHRR